MSSTYPDELPGMGLLLLRLVTGAVLTVRGCATLLGGHDRAFASGAISLLIALAGSSLLVGYLTRLGATLVVAASLGSLVPSLLGPNLAIFAARLPDLLIAAIAAALICTGPGAYSLDARRFGRHEIVIPPKPGPPMGRS
jgi:uncharacterized membrane protein YphA (DoxX/SURF4 family)